MGKIREPIKKTSIAKKNKIIKNGFELMCEEGYHNVSCVDIAKYCGVSTGIIYQYFQDKRDIFLEGVKDYSSSIVFPMIDILENYKMEDDKISNVIGDIIDICTTTHNIKKQAHEELVAMSHLDEDIKQIFRDYEFKMSEKIVSVLKNNNFNIENINEKIHIVTGIVDNYCHEVVYHKHEEFDYDIMKQEIVNIIERLLNIEE